MRFEGQKEAAENVRKMPKISGFHNEELLLALVQNSIARGLNENPIKEGSYIFTIEAINHFPTLNVAQCKIFFDFPLILYKFYDFTLNGLTA